MTESPPTPDTIAGLRERHLNLMQQWRDLEDDKFRSETADALRQSVHAAGVDIERTAERDEAQGIIDYWASAVAALEGHGYPVLLTLKPYEGARGRQAGASAQQAFESLDDETDRRLARRLFEELLRKKNETDFERSPPCTRASLEARAESVLEPKWNAILQTFEAAGAIRRLPGETVESDRFEATSAEIASTWPELQGWLNAKDKYDREVSKIESLAKRWKNADRDSDLLLRGTALTEARRFESESDLLVEYVEASQTATRRTETQKHIVIGSLIGLLVLMLIAAMSMTFYFGSESARYKRIIAEADAEKKVATEAADNAREDEKFAVQQVTIAEKRLDDKLPPVATSASALAQLDELKGAMWLGSIDRPQVRTVGGGGAKSPDFAKVFPGQRFQVYANIYLRDDMPALDGPYVSPPAKTVVPAGYFIVLESQPTGYKRSTGVQYWAKVRVVPRVYVQFAGSDRATIDAVRTDLAQAGFDVPRAERLTSAADLAEVRYFNDKDRPAATELLTVLHKSKVFPRPGSISCRSATGNTVSRFTLELWLDPTRRAKAVEIPKACP
ncbi:hypothetical protein [Asticcacaulis benevestitus]|uniref:Novel STAND NTPase 1 domain-containing protein n=1 Tax=Asticcacaulis benevestitus DSM 16100 = ATCC BAA-896 TaxID=1121022 RepID=V4PYW4_9CAUL|nr:hypothetical protein [Asticcacaulis benevestitus]ESQ92599.1 hypothetical protein ABENE_08150 [Asticcacaulis benevestitus DSM 16100 = ATCC BAA-896]